MNKTNVTPLEACEMIEAATGERFTPRRLITWARGGIGEFPKLSADAHPRLLRFETASIVAWVEKTFGATPRAKVRK